MSTFAESDLPVLHKMLKRMLADPKGLNTLTQLGAPQATGGTLNQRRQYGRVKTLAEGLVRLGVLSKIQSEGAGGTRAPYLYTVEQAERLQGLVNDLPALSEALYVRGGGVEIVSSVSAADKLDLGDLDLDDGLSGNIAGPPEGEVEQMIHDLPDEQVIPSSIIFKALMGMGKDLGDLTVQLQTLVNSVNGIHVPNVIAPSELYLSTVQSIRETFTTLVQKFGEQQKQVNTLITGMNDLKGELAKLKEKETMTCAFRTATVETARGTKR